MTIQHTGIFDKKIVSFDFHGTLVERLKHHHEYNIETSTHINRPVFEIFKKCLQLGIKTYIISSESINGSGEDGIANNEKILKSFGINNFPIENIFCTDYKAKDEWFEKLKIQFHVDDKIENILLARQMGIRGLLVDYDDHPVASMFTRIRLNGKVLSGQI